MEVAEGEGGGGGAAPVCLCVLCGLPAAGKSSLARTVLGSAAQLGWRATVVPYDDLIPGQAFHTREVEGGGDEPAMHTEWKSHRQAVLQHIQFLLRTHGTSAAPISSSGIDTASWERCVLPLLQLKAVDPCAPLLFLLDDNFYYPSMRYEVYQLARKNSLGFCQVYLHCDVESCISRNQRRPERVPTEVIRDMAKRLEPPNPQRNPWETQSISLNTMDNMTQCDVQRVTELISFALKNPLSPVEDNAEQKEADRLKCASSVVHQADQACRRLVSDAMKTARENQVSPELMRSVAAHLNESKAAFLRRLREQLLQDSSLTKDEDVDVERVVERAVDVFNREKNEILLRIMKDQK